MEEAHGTRAGHGQDDGRRARDMEGGRWGGGETRTAHPGHGVGKRFREDKEMERELLTSTDFTTAKWGEAVSAYQRNVIPRTVTQLYHRPPPTSFSLPTTFPAFSKPRPSTFHSFTSPPDPDCTASGPRMKQCGTRPRSLSVTMGRRKPCRRMCFCRIEGGHHTAGLWYSPRNPHPPQC